jgi:vitamin B12 transporter
MRLRSLLLLATPSLLLAQGDTTRLPASVITATRIPTAADAQTATVSVLDGATLRAEGVTHVGDALRRVPGLALARTSSFGSQQALFLRGGQSNYVRVLVDGVALNEPGGVLDLGRVTLDDVERIEVVRGPASVLYGSEAVTGVVQIFTRSGAGPTALRSELGGGSYGTVRGSLGASGSAGRFGWTLQGDRHSTDGVLAYNNAYANDGVTGGLTFAPDARSDLRFTARYNTSRYEYPTGSAGQLEDRNAQRTEHRLLVGVEGGRRWTGRLETRAQLTAMDLLPRTDDRADNAGDTLGFYGYVAEATVKRRVADVRTTARLGEAQFVTLGGEWSRDTERSSSVSLSEFGDFPSSFRAARETRAAYAQAHGSRGPLTYTLGGRVDHNSAFGRFETARVGAAWRIAAPLRVRASAGTAFKAPSFFENFAQGFTVGNADLRPERARSADLGVELTLPRNVAVRVTGFTQRFRDLIQYTGAPPAMGDPNYYNIAKANAGGVEFEADFLSATGVATTISHTWTDTRVVDAGFETTPEANFVNGGRLLRRPAHVTSVQVRRPLGDRGVLSATVLRTGEREDRDFATWPATVVTLDPFTTVDVSAELRLPTARGTAPRVILRAENLFDVRTQQVAGFASPGRILYAGLRLER